ncbi:methyltransferase family protein [Oceanotoga teriensis]|uniref:Methyltransferase family protein n=1 Tax=Oceanotoga teriensis TaxID=515440 RepID=A0AA45HIA5_9BACT|nr:class I SAM-dependent methyltransferase [Oceanotoga teriensis]PWJ90024.1 methyltransferase family protein [Oceanotoga teriensis]
MYEEISNFWDNIFENKKEIQLKKPLPYKEIEKSLEWLSKDSKNVIEFGCGNGILILRCFYLGINSGLGIDISKKAIEASIKSAKLNNAKNFIFNNGGIETLYNSKDNSFDSAILSNILDNISPKDAKLLLKELNRILKKDAKIFIKLNDFISDKNILNNKETFEKELEKNFYKETSGLYLYNISDYLFDELISPYFEIEDRFDIEFKKYNQKNRIWLLKNKKLFVD